MQRTIYIPHMNKPFSLVIANSWDFYFSEEDFPVSYLPRAHLYEISREAEFKELFVRKARSPLPHARFVFVPVMSRLSDFVFDLPIDGLEECNIVRSR